ncbi:GNS1/SUR4 family protein [Ostertagia ostertagi]
MSASLPTARSVTRNAMPKARTNMQVSMGVTTIQTAQMLAGVAVSYIVYRIKTESNLPCQQSMANLYLAFIIYVTFAVLFLQFFYKAYIAKV